MRKWIATFILLGVIFSINIFAQPKSPANLKASQNVLLGYSVVTLSWDNVENVYYCVYKKDGAINDPGDFKKLSFMTPVPIYMDKFVEAGHTYSYYVTSANSSGESSPSDKVEIKIDGNQPQEGEGTLTGRITDEETGKSVGLAAVEIVSSNKFFRKFILAGSDGSFSAKIPAGSYIIHYNAIGYFPEFYNNKTNLADADVVTLKDKQSLDISAALKLRLPPPQYTLSGKITDTGGNPLVADVTILCENHRLNTRMVYTAVSNSTGDYSVKLREGDSVVVFAKSRDGKTTPVFYNNKTEYTEADVILVTKDISGINFVLPPSQKYDNSITGVVKNSSGQGIRSGVTAFMLDEKKNAVFRRTVMTDQDGNYSISNLTPGSYILLAIPCSEYLPTYFRNDGKMTFKWKEADPVKLEETSKVTGIDFHVAGYALSEGYAQVKGIVKDMNGNPVSGSLVYVQNENKELISSVISGSDGSYSVENLQPGSYALFAEKVSYEQSGQANVLLDYQNNSVQNVPLTITPSSVTAVNPGTVELAQYSLMQNYPNPFNPVTAIEYSIPQDGIVTLKIYNLMGQEISTLAEGIKKQGNYKVSFNAGDLPSGLYFYRLNLNGNVLTRKMMLLK